MNAFAVDYGFSDNLLETYQRTFREISAILRASAASASEERRGEAVLAGGPAANGQGAIAAGHRAGRRPGTDGN